MLSNQGDKAIGVAVWFGVAVRGLFLLLILTAAGWAP